VSVGEAFLLILAGVGAGLIGSIAGLASLVSYPALLAAGLSPVSANVTNTVALVFSSVGSVSASGPELRGCRRAMLERLVISGAAGGILGGALLLATPADAFKRVVPWLIGLASVAVLIGPRRLPVPDVRPEDADHPTVGLIAMVFAIGVYGGYFGAGAGVAMLALLGRSFASLPVANAIKNLVLGVANGLAAVAFAIFGSVHWPFAVFLAIGLFIGGSLGPRVVRRANPQILRVLIALAGIGLAVHLAT
jgi:uncharacterized membrane protein YfcA